MVAPEAKRSLSELLLNSDYLSVMTVDMTEVLPDGLVAIVKSDCPTCELIVPVLVQLENAADLTVVTQDCDTSSRRKYRIDISMRTWLCHGITKSKQSQR